MTCSSELEGDVRSTDVFQGDRRRDGVQNHSQSRRHGTTRQTRNALFDFAYQKMERSTLDRARELDTRVADTWLSVAESKHLRMGILPNVFEERRILKEFRVTRNPLGSCNCSLARGVNNDHWFVRLCCQGDAARGNWHIKPHVEC